MIKSLEDIQTTNETIVTKLRSFFQSIITQTSVAIDLGTSMTRMAIIGKGIVLKEATYIGQHSQQGTYLFYGDEARLMYGKTPQFIQVIKPLEGGILSDFDGCVALLEHFMQKAILPYYKNASLIKPGMKAFIAIPSSATEVEQKATKEAFRKVGFTSVHLTLKPYAFASGARGSIFHHMPLFVADISAGLTEIAVVISGGIVSSKTITMGGNYMDRQLQHYLQLKYGVVIGEQTTSLLKDRLLNLQGTNDSQTARGKSLETGLPKSLKVTASDVREATATSINHIVDAVREVIESIPPELVDGVVQKGLVLTGGLSQVPGIADYISKEIKIPVSVAEHPEMATINGLIRLARQKGEQTVFF